MEPIPFFDLKQQHKQLKPDLDKAFSEIVGRSEFILGAPVKQFEEAFANFVGCKYAVGVNSGLEALELSLRAAGVGPGDEVIVPANTFIATALAVSAVGATPVFVDAEPQRCLIDFDSVQKALSKKTKAILPVHLYGQPVEMEPLLKLCDERGIILIEDACQAHGAHINGHCCGNFGRFGCFSFYPSKNLGALGDGGAITVNDKADYDLLCLLRNYGSTVKYRHEIAGFNSRLDSLQAAFLSIKLRYLKQWNEMRVLLARRYDERLTSGAGDVRLLKPKEGYYAVHHLYVIRTQKRQALQNFLQEHQVGTVIHYPVPIHKQPAYQNLSKKTVGLSVAESDADQLLSLPIYPEMIPETVDRVCGLIKEFFSR